MIFLEAGFWTFFEKADQSIGWLLRVTYDMAIMRQLLQGLSSPLRQSNDTFHGQTGHQDGMARQARHSEIRLLNTLNSLFDILIRMSKA